MCGISGIISRDIDCQIPVEWIENMMAVQKHRGPDDWQHVRLTGARLGFNRLSIQDVSDNGRQPMNLPGSETTIVFNGEIYNFKELAESLTSDNINLSSRSDTEVLLHHFIRNGEQCLDALNGMFGFAVYSPSVGELFSARDRFGIKPFYYFKNEIFFVSLRKSKLFSLCHSCRMNLT